MRDHFLRIRTLKQVYTNLEKQVQTIPVYEGNRISVEEWNLIFFDTYIFFFFFNWRIIAFIRFYFSLRQSSDWDSLTFNLINSLT